MNKKIQEKSHLCINHMVHSVGKTRFSVIVRNTASTTQGRQLHIANDLCRNFGIKKNETKHVYLCKTVAETQLLST